MLKGKQQLNHIFKMLDILADHISPSPLREQLSSVFGSISFACWLILMVPQLVEQWRLKTVEGISPFFLLMWASGDVFNFLGAIWGGLLPEVILIAFWFLFADFGTLAFYFYISKYYDHAKHGKHGKLHHHHLNHSNTEVVESTPLNVPGDLEYGVLGDDSGIHHSNATDDHHNIDHHNHNHHHHHHHHNERRKSSTIEDVVYEPERHSVFVRIVLPLLLVIAAGTFGSILSPNASVSSLTNGSSTATANDLVPQICGYLSAILYLTARFPQIYHNYKKQSTEGLSLLFFLLTMLGNITYSLQIFAYSTDPQYIMLNMSWLLGSAGTIVEDLIIVAQFYMYRNNHNL